MHTRRIPILGARSTHSFLLQAYDEVRIALVRIAVSVLAPLRWTNARCFGVDVTPTARRRRSVAANFAQRVLRSYCTALAVFSRAIGVTPDEGNVRAVQSVGLLPSPRPCAAAGSGRVLLSLERKSDAPDFSTGSQVMCSL